MPLNAPAIVKASESLLVAIEEAVSQFPRYHKYAVGAELRGQAREVARRAHRAWLVASVDRLARIDDLSIAIDDLKLTLQIAQRLHALKSFGQFEALARQVSDLGRQCGGWQRKLRSNGQNRTATVPAGRAESLSVRDASVQGANL